MVVPVNDPFANSIVLNGTEFTVFGSNTGATGESGEPNHARVSVFDDPANAESIWWTWTAPESGLVSLDTFGSNYDTTLAVYTGDSVNNLTEIASNDDYSSLQSQVTFNATAGQTYRIAVDGYGAADGDITLNLRTITLPEELGGKNLIPPDLPDRAKAAANSVVFFPDTARAAYDADSVPKGATNLRSNVFSTDANANVFNSTQVPWTSVEGNIGDNSVDSLTGLRFPLSPENDVDFYQVSARAGQTLTIDIDNGIGGNGSFDSAVWLFNSKNELLAFNDDFFPEDPGSISVLDSYLQYGVESSGQYYIAVTSYGNFWDGNSWTYSGSSTGDYTLNVNIG
ncbi:PPC domain-containing protein [Nostoc flagelliforme FACHB-838]|uniref:PPC domain-containing protein n=1 Tax=Nostoc flagelliforme FACHB-838 TaxID=2692904 RepID=A0ABR8E2B5_9NOSO|nr:DVUA0089 family protein [Nostoc flagelliforme]MBD2535716.1 PPC domain-containing protein [Nostoc flagelliforme FACHB-838]